LCFYAKNISSDLRSYALTEEKALKAKITVAGAGPIGCMLAIILSRKNCNVEVFESRPDVRGNKTYQGKSINIALSDRAWLALKNINLDNEVRKYAIPLTKRTIHSMDGSSTSQDYGSKKQAIWSISRAKLNKLLLDQAEQEPHVNLHFEQRLTHVDFVSGCASFSYQKGGRSAHKEIDADYVFAADGAYSKVRRLAQDTPRFNYSQSYMKQCYIELTISANVDGSYKLDKNALHLWPRQDFMLMALANTDGSFTCTLFLNYQGDLSFESLTSQQSVSNFFQQYFASVLPLLDNPIETFINKTANPLFLVSVDPWVINNKVVLIGDAAHAMVPFYGQGLNCSFEDCYQLSQFIDQHQDNWPQIFLTYQNKRKKNADAISKISKDNFIEINRLSHDKHFQLRKKIEDTFQHKYPDLWHSLYHMVSFCPEISYHQARNQSNQQELLLDEIMKIDNIEMCWQDDFIYEKLKRLVQNQGKT